MKITTYTHKKDNGVFTRKQTIIEIEGKEYFSIRKHKKGHFEMYAFYNGNGIEETYTFKTIKQAMEKAKELEALIKKEGK